MRFDIHQPFPTRTSTTDNQIGGAAPNFEPWPDVLTRPPVVNQSNCIDLQNLQFVDQCLFEGIDS